MLQTFDALPPELLVSVLVCGSTYDLGRMSCTCSSFRALVEVALRQRAGLCSERDAELPEGEVSWTQLLLWRERRRRPCGKVLAAGRMHSAFADAEGRLLTCGTDGDGHGFLGHGDEVVDGSISAPLPLESLGGLGLSCSNTGGTLPVANCSRSIVESLRKRFTALGA